MNFSFIRKSFLVFVTSNVYYNCALDACDFFLKPGVFFTSKGQVNEPVLRGPPIATSGFIGLTGFIAMNKYVVSPLL